MDLPPFPDCCPKAVHNLNATTRVITCISCGARHAVKDDAWEKLPAPAEPAVKPAASKGKTTPTS